MAKREPIRVLVADDAATCRAMLADVVRRDARYRLVGEAESVEEGLRLAERERPQVVVLDACMEDRSGLDAVQDFRRTVPGLRVVLVSGHVGKVSHEGALAMGVDAYTPKAAGGDGLLAAIQRALAAHAETRLAEPQIEWVGSSPASQLLRRELRDIAERDVRVVLVTGPSGSGKELAAHLIRRWGRRANKPWLPVNCGAISENLLESEFFGHSRASFTGAVERQGHLRATDGGIVVMDEIGDMPLKQQPVFLRVLETGMVVPVGASDPVCFDVQFLALTHRDLAEQVERGAFREDLYYRLTRRVVRVPALDERLEDIPALTAYRLAELARREGCPRPKILSHDAERLMLESRWPGGVRKLFHVIDAANDLAGPNPELDAEQIEAAMRRTAALRAVANRGVAVQGVEACAPARGAVPPGWPPPWFDKGTRDRGVVMRAVRMARELATGGAGVGTNLASRVASLLRYSERYTRNLLRSVDAAEPEPNETPARWRNADFAGDDRTSSDSPPRLSCLGFDGNVHYSQRRLQVWVG